METKTKQQRKRAEEEICRLTQAINNIRKELTKQKIQKDEADAETENAIKQNEEENKKLKIEIAKLTENNETLKEQNHKLTRNSTTSIDN